MTRSAPVNVMPYAQARVVSKHTSCSAVVLNASIRCWRSLFGVRFNDFQWMFKPTEHETYRPTTDPSIRHIRIFAACNTRAMMSSISFDWLYQMRWIGNVCSLRCNETYLKMRHLCPSLTRFRVIISNILSLWQSWNNSDISNSRPSKSAIDMPLMRAARALCS